MNRTLDGVYFSPFSSTKPNASVEELPNDLLYNSDGRTHMMMDRIVNNIKHISFVETSVNNRNNSVFVRFAHLAKEMAKALTERLPMSILDEAAPHLLQFAKDANILDKGIAHILNLVRAVISTSEVVLGHVVEALSYLLPIYWNLATAIITLPIKIPFVYEWYTQRFTRYVFF